MTDQEKIIQDQIIQSTNAALQPRLSLDQFIAELGTYINDLIAHDFSTLVSILYRLDVPEKKLKQTIAASAGENAGLIIAKAIVDRQIAKAESRKKYSMPDADIPPDEKW